MFAQNTRGAGLVGFHEPAVADHIARKDCGEAAVHLIPRSSLHGILPGRPILYRGAPARTTDEGLVSHPTQPILSAAEVVRFGAWPGVAVHEASGCFAVEIGRASCREGVKISVW